MTKLELIDRFNSREGDGALTAAGLDQLIRDETIPPHFVTKDGGRAGKQIHLAPVTFAVVALLQHLQGAFGEQSPLPKRVVKALIPQIERRWMNPQIEDKLVLDQEFDDGSGRVLTVVIRPSFITKARALVA